MLLLAGVFGGGRQCGLLGVGYRGGFVDEGLLLDDGVAVGGFHEIDCGFGFHYLLIDMFTLYRL